MKPQVQKILTKLGKEQEKKVELAKNPNSILKTAQSLSDKIKKLEDKMEDAYQKYRSSTEEYSRKLSEIESKAIDLDDDLDIIEDKAKDLGVKPEQIDGYDKARTLVRVLKDAKNTSRSYPTL